MRNSSFRTPVEYSEDMKNVIYNPISWRLKYGIALILMVITCLVFASSAIRYQERLTMHLLQVDVTKAAMDTNHNCVAKISFPIRKKLRIFNGQQIIIIPGHCNVSSMPISGTIISIAKKPYADTTTVVAHFNIKEQDYLKLILRRCNGPGQLIIPNGNLFTRIIDGVRGFFSNTIK